MSQKSSSLHPAIVYTVTGIIMIVTFPIGTILGGIFLVYWHKKQKSSSTTSLAPQPVTNASHSSASISVATNTTMTPAEEAYNPLAGARLVRNRYTIIG